jgi:hypothetical protein
VFFPKQEESKGGVEQQGCGARGGGVGRRSVGLRPRGRGAKLDPPDRGPHPAPIPTQLLTEPRGRTAANTAASGPSDRAAGRLVSGVLSAVLSVRHCCAVLVCGCTGYWGPVERRSIPMRPPTAPWHAPHAHMPHARCEPMRPRANPMRHAAPCGPMPTPRNPMRPHANRC